MNDRGHAGVELAFAVGDLLLPVAVVVAGFGPWSETRVASEAIAAEAARATVLDLSHESGMAAVDSTAASMGLDRDLVRIGWCGASPTGDGSGSCGFERGSAVSVAVEVWVPVLSTPWGAIGGIWVVGEHSEPIDLYRSLG
jgi:hypothetical protein